MHKIDFVQISAIRIFFSADKNSASNPAIDYGWGSTLLSMWWCQSAAVRVGEVDSAPQLRSDVVYCTSGIHLQLLLLALIQTTRYNNIIDTDAHRRTWETTSHNTTHTDTWDRSNMSASITHRQTERERERETDRQTLLSADCLIHRWGMSARQTDRFNGMSVGVHGASINVRPLPTPVYTVAQ